MNIKIEKLKEINKILDSVLQPNGFKPLIVRGKKIDEDTVFIDLPFRGLETEWEYKKTVGKEKFTSSVYISLEKQYSKSDYVGIRIRRDYRGCQERSMKIESKNVGKILSKITAKKQEAIEKVERSARIEKEKLEKEALMKERMKQINPVKGITVEIEERRYGREAFIKVIGKDFAFSLHTENGKQYTMKGFSCDDFPLSRVNEFIQTIKNIKNKGDGWFTSELYSKDKEK